MNLTRGGVHSDQRGCAGGSCSCLGPISNLKTENGSQVKVEPLWCGEWRSLWLPVFWLIYLFCILICSG